MIFSILLVLFIVLPVTELALLLKVGEVLHLGGTLALVVGTGILGAALARHQGLRQLAQIQQALAEGRMPAPQVVDGMLILLAGAVLMTPGLITDTAGFFLLVPAGRNGVRRIVGRWLQRKIRNGVVDVTYVEW